MRDLNDLCLMVLVQILVFRHKLIATTSSDLTVILELGDQINHLQANLGVNLQEAGEGVAKDVVETAECTGGQYMYANP